MSLYDSSFLNLCDAELQSEEGENFQVHRIILAMKSEYFSYMFCDMNEDRRQFKITGISGNCLREILKYIYTGEMNLHPDKKLLELMLAADKFNLPDLYLQIKQYLTKVVNDMPLTISNCLNVLNTASNIKDEEMTRNSFRFVKAKFEEIVRLPKNDVADLPLELLEDILRSRSLKVSSESTVWLSIVQWTSKDIASRSECMPRLLMSLAREELDEKLAKEILQHQIVLENSFMKDLNGLKDSPDFTGSLDALSHYLENNSSSFKQPLPARLNIIAYSDGAGTCSLYITYDENIDLWRKIGEISKYYFNFITVIAHNVYLFGSNECKKFDLVGRQWLPMSTFQHKLNFLSCHKSVLQIDGFVYVVVECHDYVTIKIYDAVHDSWLDGELLSDVKKANAATFNKMIYVLGEGTSEEMTFRTFDTVNKKWKVLPPPRVHRDLFSLLAFCEKVYVMGGHDWRTYQPVTNFEVFDPKTRSWKELSQLPFSSVNTHAVVFNDQIVAFDYINPSNVFFWNGVVNQWKELRSNQPIDFSRFVSTSVTDEETIRTVMKMNQDPGTSWQKSLFDC